MLEIEDTQSQDCYQFIVSTKVLSLASPVFLKMFACSFKEGLELRASNRARVRLREDDNSAMNIILRILHYRWPEHPEIVDAERLASIAVHCDKYDCTMAMAPWASRWFDRLAPVVDAPEELEFLLLAAYKLNDAQQFAKVSARAVPIQTLGSHRCKAILHSLPDLVQGT